MSPRRSDSREKIVAAARRMFYTRGYGETSLGDLARASGVPKGNFYYHFPTKDDVLRAVVEARRADIDAALQRWGAAHPSPRDRLGRFVEMITSERADLVSYGCPTGSLLTELGKAQGGLRDEALAIMELYVRFTAAAITTLGHAPDDARRHAVHLMSRLQGAILMAQAYGDPQLLDQELDRARGWLESL